MLIPGTEMHVVTFVFAALEIVMFFYQLIFYLSRTEDKARLWYLILLFLLILYNIMGGLLPDPQFSLPIILQNCISYGTGFLMAAYFPYYFYKAFNLEGMKFHAYRGVYICILIPYLLFVGLYYSTSNLEYAAQWGMSIPIVYSLVLLYSITRSVIRKFREHKTKRDINEIVGLYLAYCSWIAVPLVTYFQGSQALEYSFSNTGFLVMTVLFVRKTVQQSREEYRELQELNASLTQKVQERTEELQRANEQKTHTFINIAHEIKTPLTLINNYLDEYIQKYDVTAKEMRVIQTNIAKLNRDIINYFDLERFSKGLDVYQHHQICDFSQLLNESVVLFASYCRAKGIAFRAAVEEHICLQADPDAVSRIVNNLIENAIKYTPMGGNIEVLLFVAEDKVHFQVRDSGVGIGKPLQPHIFEPYFQINSPKMNSQGMGLGLSIVQNIVVSLNGSISLQSDPLSRPGTEITILLPNPLSAHVHGDRTTTHRMASSVLEPTYEIGANDDEKLVSKAGSTILVVEDNAELLQYYVEKLQGQYHVFSASDGADALQKLAHMPTPDLIISDVMMPGMDGFQLAIQLKADAAYAHIPIIYLTAKTTQIDRLKGLQLAIDYIAKPFSFPELAQKVESVLDTMQKQKRAVLNNVLASASQTLANLPGAYASITHDPFALSCDTFQLTHSEVKVVRQIAKGQSYKEIGEELYISEKTVAKHVQNIFRKVNVNNKVELLYKLGLQQTRFSHSP